MANEAVLVRFVQEQVDVLQPLLGLQNWVIEVNLPAPDVKLEARTIMRIEWSADYLFATLTVNAAADNVQRWLSGIEGRRRVLHEMIHLLLAGYHDFQENQFRATSLLWNLFCDVDERMVDTMTNVIFRLVQGLDGAE